MLPGVVHANIPIVVTCVFLILVMLLAKGYTTRVHLGYSRILNLFLLGLGGILLWRGVWNLCAIYLFPWNPEFSNWLSIIFGLGILTVMSFDFHI